jgi:hypothetical protein
MFNSFAKVLKNITNVLFGSYNRNLESNIIYAIENDEPTPEKAIQEQIASVNADKRKCFEDALRHGIAKIYFDPRHEKNSVPERFKNQDTLVLSYSYSYGLNDFHITDEFVVATLSFSRMPFYCCVHWDSVFMIEGQQDVSQYTGDEKKSAKTNMKLVQAERSTIDSEIKQETRQKPKLTLIKGGKQ